VGAKMGKKKLEIIGPKAVFFTIPEEEFPLPG
jgi:hypothetical protein